MPEPNSSEPTIPAEPQVRYTVRLTRTVAENVAAAYDVTVEVPPGTPEETITARAAQKVDGYIASVIVDDLTYAHHELEAVVLDANYREQTPATLATIEVVEQIRYEHDGRKCEGALFAVEASTDESSRLKGLVVATQIDGDSPGRPDRPQDSAREHRGPSGGLR